MKEVKLKWGSAIKIKGWDGLNNAAINTFNSNVISSFVRENFQNSNDARQKDKKGNRKKLFIEIDYKTISSDLFPNYKEFISTLENIANDSNNSQHNLFFKQALGAINDRKQIGVLVYQDFNTTGLSGEDDDANSSFNACVLSEGQSIKKDSDSGGSYGIGKNSIFGISKTRTVIYSSFNTSDEIIFQGLSKLASYKSSEGTHESRIYYGIGKQLSSIRNKHLSFLDSDLKSFYVRNEPGLSQFAFCPNISSTWKDEFIMSILKNYWPLIYNDELEVTVKEQGNNVQKVTSETLDGLMTQYYSPDSYDPDDSEPKGNPFDYYTCYKNCVSKEAKIHMLGTIKFYYSELSHKKTNRILYIRNGMVICAEEVWGFGAIGYCGIVECTNVEGNTFLKMMEPPEHNRFDVSRLNEKSEKYKAADGEKAFKEIKKLIRESLNEILNQYRKKAEDIPWLNNLIQSIKGLNGLGSGNRTGEAAERETIERISSIKKRKLTFSSIEKNSLINTEHGEVPNATPSPQPPPQATPPKPSPQPQPPRDPHTGGATTIRYRIFRRSNIKGVATYKIIISSDKTSKNRNFKIFQIGDSGNVASFELLEVKNTLGNSVTFQEIRNKEKELTAYQINSVDIPDALEFTIKEPYKSTFSIQLVN